MAKSTGSIPSKFETEIRKKQMLIDHVTYLEQYNNKCQNTYSVNEAYTYQACFYGMAKSTIVHYVSDLEEILTCSFEKIRLNYLYNG